MMAMVPCGPRLVVCVRALSMFLLAGCQHDLDPLQDGQQEQRGDGIGQVPASGETDAGGFILTCGNGRLDARERCDVAIPEGRIGACPSGCSTSSACSPEELVGSSCNARCEPVPAECTGGDGCCPGQCGPDTDSDCSGHCGDGIVQAEEGETCEPGSSRPCPTAADCDDGEPCTRDMLTGSEDNCNARCSRVEITRLAGGDRCCPSGADANLDSDCDPSCGNDVVERGEQCDGPVGCEECQLTMTPEQTRCVEGFASDSCRECQCIECTRQALDCLDSADAARDAQCTAVDACSSDANCVGSACYCGNALLCLTPNGPCRQEVEQAAGTSVPLDVNAQASEPSTAVYRAFELGQCGAERCSQVCP